MAARTDPIALDPDKVVATIEQLEARIAERFPGSGLAKVAATLLGVARAAVARAREIRSPRLLLRAISAFLLLAMAALLLFAALHARPPPGRIDAFELVQAIEATLSGFVLLGALVLFVVTIEVRLKRKRTLEALHELRVLAHVIDMHQLAKDPERATDGFTATASSPRVELTSFQLDRYLNYCGDLLALVGKVAAWYLQGFQDEVVLGAVNEIEDLTNGLSRKIWQKLMLLDQMTQRGQRGCEGPSASSAGPR